jgi:hypothetical protein
MSSSAHEETVNLFWKAATGARYADVKAFAAKTFADAAAPLADGVMYKPQYERRKQATSAHP